ncbi:MAG: hypothetical protein H6807_06315 [Planctomycetes bacterium]|nr:hypothetical protein [Planctomycetota bacterium]
MTKHDHRTGIDLNDLKIATPCPESWADMRGDDRRRFCKRCAMNVYDLSGMTRAEAAALVGEAEGRLCIRLHRRRDGTVITRDCPVGLAARTGRFLKACAAGLLTLLGFLPGCQGREPEVTTGKTCPEVEGPRPEDELEPLMGEMVMPEDATGLEPRDQDQDREVLIGKVHMGQRRLENEPADDDR